MGAPVDVDQRAARLPGDYSTEGLKRAAGQPRWRPRPFSCAWEIPDDFQEVYYPVVSGPAMLPNFRGFSAPWSMTANSLSPEAALPSAKATSQTARLRASPLVSLVGTGFERAMSPLPSLLTLKRFVISTFIGRWLSVDVGEVSRHAVQSSKPRLASSPCV